MHWHRYFRETARRWRLRLLLLLVGATLLGARLQASNAILLWPLDPVIEATDAGAALWVENRGQRTATMQLRVLAWTQDGGEHRHAPQTDIVGTPAIFRIEPGKRQFVRLTRTQAPRPGAEQAYRVLIDEIPDSRGVQLASASKPSNPGSGLRFQLRYSIPLFSYGVGLASSKQADPARDAARLQWHQGGDANARWVEIRNAGLLHAKLVDLQARGEDGRAIDLRDGHLGYVLAGSSGRWTLPGNASRVASVHAAINGGTPRPIDPGMP